MELTIDQALQKAIHAHKSGQLQEAERIYRLILNAEPKHADANHNLGVLAVSVGNVSKASSLFKIALEARPNTAQFWVSYIETLIQLENFDEAKKILLEARKYGAKGIKFDGLDKKLREIQRGANLPVQHFDRLIDLYQSGKLRECLEQIEVIVPNFSEAAILFNLKGAILTQLGRPGHAVEALKHAISIKFDYAEAYNNMGLALKELDKLAEAVEAFDTALDLNSNLVDAYSNRASVFKRLGKYHDAVNDYQTAIQRRPDHAEAYYDMGVTLQEQENLNLAIEAYERALKIKPNYAEAYYNLGNAYKIQNKLHDAMAAYKKASLIKTDFAQAFYNLGVLMQELEMLEEAIRHYKIAIDIQPQYADAFYNMGNALREQDKFEEALKAYEKVIVIKPEFAEAYYNMGVTYQQSGKTQIAIEFYNQALKINPNYVDAYYNIANALKNLRFNKLHPEIEEKILFLLENQTIVRPKDIARAAISLIKCQPLIKELFLFEYSETLDLDPAFGSKLLGLCEIPLLINLMSICVLPDLEIERLLSATRAYILMNLTKIDHGSELLSLQTALALHCFTNEYVYKNSYAEIEVLKKLEISIQDRLACGDQPNPHDVLCLASYNSLYGYDWCDKLQNNRDIEKVVIRQILEPRSEQQIKSKIPVLGEIRNKVSSNVRTQYEENPYPRWINLSLTKDPLSISDLTKSIKLQLSDPQITSINEPNILVAGCGTGQHSIETARRFQGSRVLAIDLSTTSLAYAIRKTQEMNIHNIDYMQADILNLQKLNRKFDIVESAGVLHHMEDPMRGWRILTDCLKPGGLMRIGLYSKIARQQISNIRAHLALERSEQNIMNIRVEREKIYQSNDVDCETITKSTDFYSFSTIRDLIFHVQEHQFTLPQIRDCLKSLGLNFCGFDAVDLIQIFQSSNSVEHAIYDLDEWNHFEKANPTAFSGMYQFWCQKPFLPSDKH